MNDFHNWEARSPWAKLDPAARASYEGDQTSVTWSMSGRINLISKAVCLFMDMDKMVGGRYEEGLANLRSVVETATTR